MSPCQGESREFESRNPLHINIRRHSQVVRQRSAKSLSPVRVWVAPPNIQYDVRFEYRIFVSKDDNVSQYGIESIDVFV